MDTIIDKLALKHQVEPQEVEEALRNRPKIRFVEKGNREGEDVYMALSQTDEGRYLTTLFIYKPVSWEQKTAEALILSARDMAEGKKNLWKKITPCSLILRRLTNLLIF